MKFSLYSLMPFLVPFSHNNTVGIAISFLVIFILFFREQARVSVKIVILTFLLGVLGCISYALSIDNDTDVTKLFFMMAMFLVVNHVMLVRWRPEYYLKVCASLKRALFIFSSLTILEFALVNFIMMPSSFQQFSHVAGFYRPNLGFAEPSLLGIMLGVYAYIILLTETPNALSFKTSIFYSIVVLGILCTLALSAYILLALCLMMVSIKSKKAGMIGVLLLATIVLMMPAAIAEMIEKSYMIYLYMAYGIENELSSVGLRVHSLFAITDFFVKLEWHRIFIGYGFLNYDNILSSLYQTHPSDSIRSGELVNMIPVILYSVGIIGCGILVLPILIYMRVQRNMFSAMVLIFSVFLLYGNIVMPYFYYLLILTVIMFRSRRHAHT